MERPAKEQFFRQRRQQKRPSEDQRQRQQISMRQAGDIGDRFQHWNRYGQRWSKEGSEERVAQNSRKQCHNAEPYGLEQITTRGEAEAKPVAHTGHTSKG